MTQEFECRSIRELFGVGGGKLGAVFGIDCLYKVADNLDEFRQNLENSGLGVNSSPEDDQGTFGIITKGGVGLDFPFHYFKGDNRGIWIEDINGYKDLLGLA